MKGNLLQREWLPFALPADSAATLSGGRVRLWWCRGVAAVAANGQPDGLQTTIKKEAMTV